MKILITGGSGLIGTSLTSFLYSQGHRINHLSRQRYKSKKAEVFVWNVFKGEIDDAAFKEIDVIINLAGANIAEGRWTASRKEEIIRSRVNATKLLYQAIAKLKNKPKLIVSASATGYYGISDFEEISTEESVVGEDFLASVCKKWEEEADKFESLNLRVVKLRIGVVLSGLGGALSKMTPPISFGAGSSLGSGKQYLNWIHDEDLCGIINHIIENKKLNGVYNGVAPYPETNRSFTRLIAKVLNKSIWLPNLPALVLKLLFGEMSSVILNGNKAIADKIIDSGYKFKYETAEPALHNILVKD